MLTQNQIPKIRKQPTKSLRFNLKDHAKSITYGGLDGIITTFAVVAGAIGGSLGTLPIIVLGFSNLLADGFSMAAGDYLSSTTEDLDDPRHALMNAVVTFLSFNLFGLVPLLAYLLLEGFTNLSSHATFITSSSLVSLSLIALGWVKATITQQSRFKEIIRTLVVGLLAALVAYVVGQLLGNLI